MCGYTGIIQVHLPRLWADGGRRDPAFERIRRITGYLAGTLDCFNDAKRAEQADRVKHGLDDESWIAGPYRAPLWTAWAFGSRSMFNVWHWAGFLWLALSREWYQRVINVKKCHAAKAGLSEKK